MRSTRASSKFLAKIGRDLGVRCSAYLRTGPKSPAMYTHPPGNRIDPNPVRQIGP